MIHSINPFDNQVLASYENLSPQQLQDKVTLAETRFNEWRFTSIEERATYLRKLSDVLKANSYDIARLATVEMGKPLSEAKAEVLKCAKCCDYYAEHASEFLKPISISTDHKTSEVHYRPIGTVLIIMPWNFPYWQVIRQAVPALMAGNTVLLKHASNVPQCSLKLEELFLKSGFPESCFQSLMIGSEQVPQLLSNKAIAAVALTGSEAAGRTVASISGKELKKQVLELGGSDAFLVLPDADIENAASMAVKSRFQNNGQSCIAAKRFFVHESIYTPFVNFVAAKIKALISGNPLDMETNLGPMAKEEFAAELYRQVQESIQQGAELVTGGKYQKTMFEPSLLIKCNTDMTVFKEEVFGPVMAIASFSNDEDVLEAINSSPYGLGASIWTENPEAAKWWIDRITAGSVFVNTMVQSDPRLPFGGTKNSGYGRELGREGILEFVNVKTVVVN